MTELNTQIEDTVSLVEQNFEFLHVGMFLNKHVKDNNLSSKVIPIKYKCESGKTYTLDGHLAKEALLAFNQNKPTVFGYLVMWNSCRGIGMAMSEGLKDDSKFKTFLKAKLGDRYEHFHAILCFIRNVLSHNIHNEIRLKKDDYEGTRNKFKKIHLSGIAAFSIKYADDFPDMNAPNNYEFNIEVDFNSLIPGKRFIEVISEWHLFMFSELCYNFAKAFRKNIEYIR